VQTRAGRSSSATVLLITISLGASAVTDFQSSVAAMACCAKTDYACAGLRAPDDCCQGMGHAAGGTVAGTLSPVHSPELVAVAISVSSRGLASSEPLSSKTALTRPHDPPHLHRYNPLI
jgi:hypothetical protein